MPNTIEAKERELRRIFCNEFFFRIPTYQRPYAWQKEQVGELLSDLLDQLPERDDTSIGDLGPYFLGSIVLIKPDPMGADADVVDGQQRLTTLSILFAALRELTEGEKANALHRFVCEEGDPFSGAVSRFRLQPRQQDRDFFQHYVQERGGFAALEAMDPFHLPDPQKNMRANALHLRNELAKLDAGRRDLLAKFILQCCYLVVVTTTDMRSAYRIFSVMNDRGLDLSPTDILKADIIGALNERERVRYTKIWEDMEEDLTRDGFLDLFGHIRMIHTKAKPRQELVQDLRERAHPAEAPAAFIDNQLVPYADAFTAIRGAEYESATLADSINAHLTYLGRLDNADWMPPAILYFARNMRDPQRLLSFVRDLERLAYSQFVRRSGINDRMGRYGDLLRAIERDNDLSADGSPLQLSAAEKRRTLEALDGDIYTVGRIRLPLLLRVDAMMAEHGVTHHPEFITVEHVLPQNPAEGGEWMTLFPDPEVRAGWVHRLGNLALLTGRKNSGASNYHFSRKKTEYFQRHGKAIIFALTTDVLNYTKWTPEVVQERQTRILKRIAEVWRLN